MPSGRETGEAGGQGGQAGLAESLSQLGPSGLSSMGLFGGLRKEERDKSRKHCDAERIRGRPYRRRHSVENRDRENFSTQY